MGSYPDHFHITKSNMKLSELKARIDYIAETFAGWEDIEVGIPNNKGGMGGTSVTKVRGARHGIDWDRGVFVIYPSVDMVEKINGRSI